MALEVLTNERDKHGNLIRQLIVTDQEEAHYKKLANEVFSERQKEEYKAMGLPFGTDEADEKRGRIFRSLVTFHGIGRWILLTVAALLAGRVFQDVIDSIEIGFKK